MTQKETSTDDSDRNNPAGGAAGDPAVPPIEIDVHDESERYRRKAQNSAGAGAGAPAAAQDS